MLLPWLSLPIILLQLARCTTALDCYGTNGNLVSRDFQPCIAIDGVQSMCCGLNRTEAENPDICLANGLCFNKDSNSFFFDSCTDKDWNSPNCLSRTLCPQVNRAFTSVTTCSDGTWCCGFQNFTGCCNKNLGFRLNATLVSVNAAAATITVTATVTPSGGNSAEKASTGGTVKTAVLGGVAAGLGVLVLCALAGGFWVGLRKGRGQRSKQMGDYTAHPPLFQEYKEADNANAVHEVGVDSRLVELPVGTRSPTLMSPR
ncbi:hypothetical protein B0O99DRAFT_389491 [Bisporella sp. PMI_857]|nr:hypothetical protein B0O99DRAFT_389491 [Bisporella sp. PMI_857]